MLLALLYGQGADALGRRLELSPDEATDLIRRVRNAMPAMQHAINKIKGAANACGKVLTMSGRVIPLDPDPESGGRRYLGYKGVNFHVQGSTYDLLSEALYEIHQQGLGDAVYVAIHDELIVATEAAEDVQRIMLTPPQDFITQAGRVPVLRVSRQEIGSILGGQAITIRPFVTCFGIRRPSETVEKVAVHAVREGYAVVPLRPGRKVPDICTLNPRELKAAGKHQCGVHHAITEPTIAGRVFKRLAKEYDAPLNIGVVAGPSRLIVVDADSADVCEAFLADWAAAESDDGYRDHEPTVRTPGAVGADGEWKHKDGGHWYFAVPDGVTLELGRQVIKAPGGYDIRWGWSMTVVLPSSRKEGPYLPVGGDVLDAPAFLVDAILTDTARVAEKRQRNMMVFANHAIASWSLRVDWFDLLVEDGWRDTSKIDSCGCPIFEKPGGGSSTDKSATAHNGECTFYQNFEDHGPLRLWTTQLSTLDRVAAAGPEPNHHKAPVCRLHPIRRRHRRRRGR